MRHFRALLKSRAGISTVEFAIILPALLTLICGSIELGHMLFARVVLEGAMTEAAHAHQDVLRTTDSLRTTVVAFSVMRSPISQFMPRNPNRMRLGKWTV